MEPYIVGLLSVLAGVIAFLIGQRLQPKSDALKKTAAYWKEEVESLRTEIKRYRAKAHYYQKGAIPSELGNASTPEALIEGIIDNLPANYKMLLAPMKGQIINAVKNNPELLEYAPALIQKFLGNKGNEQENGTTTEML